MALVAEIEEELAAGGLDPFLRLGQVIDLESEMVCADRLGRIALDVVALAAGKIEQRQIDHAVAQVDRRADVEILALDPLQPEHLFVEFCGLLQVADANGEVA